MSFTFIHTADWQLGKPFGGMPDETAVLLRAARLDAIDRIAAVATAAGAQHVLVAGDVFDTEKPPQRLIGQTLARLAAHRDLTWHLLPGNHDPARPGSVWDDIARSKPAANIRCHTAAEPQLIKPDVLLLPAPLNAKAMSHDPTAYMDQVASPRGTLRIGMAHGSVRGFDSLGEASIPIEPTRAKTANLDYLALGDWHGYTPIDKRTFYSGTHEPDGYKDNKPGHVLVVKIDAQGAEPEVRMVSTQQYTWRRLPLALTSTQDFQHFAAQLASDPAFGARLLLKLDITGRIPLAEFSDLQGQHDALGAALAHLDADLTAIEMATSADDLTALARSWRPR